MDNTTYANFSKNWSYQVKFSVDRPRQYSDVGRTPLGKVDDEENLKVQELIEGSVSNETKLAWDAYATSMRDKYMEVLFDGNKDEDLKSKQTFPKKVKEIPTATSEDDEIASTSNRKVIFADKYKLNRKVILKKAEEVVTIPRSASVSKIEPATSEQPLKSITRPSTKDQKEEAFKNLKSFINKRKANPDDVLGENKKSVGIVAAQPVENASSSSLLADYGFPKTKEPNVEEVCVEVVEECVLHKYGHCWDSTSCTLAHNGVVNKNKNRNPETQKWEKKDAAVKLCPGYLSRKCWNMSCSLRHVLYGSDIIDSST